MARYKLQVAGVTFGNSESVVEGGSEGIREAAGTHIQNTGYNVVNGRARLQIGSEYVRIPFLFLENRDPD